MQDTLAFHCGGKCEKLKCVQQYCISRICIADHLHRDEACSSRYCLMKVLCWRGLSWYGAHADTDHGLVTLGVGYKKKQRNLPKKERAKVGIVHFLFAKISENHHQIYCLLYHFPIILLMVKNKTM